MNTHSETGHPTLNGLALEEPKGFELPPLPIEEMVTRESNPTGIKGKAWIVGDVDRMMSDDPPPVRWLVEGLIPAGMVGVLAGRANAGKSMIALHISMGVAAGMDVLGRSIGQSEARGVLFVGMEDDENEFHRRLHRGAALLQEDPEWSPEHRESLIQRFVPLFPNRASEASFSLENQWRNLAEQANAIPGGCGLIFIDTLARMAKGDENSAKDMGHFNDAMFALAQATKATVIAIHHVGKGHDVNSDKTLMQRLDPEALRGSSALEGAIRFVIQMAALSPAEAKVARLDMDTARKGAYVAMRMSKLSVDERGDTVVMERRGRSEVGAGFLSLHPESDQILESIHGEAAVAKLNRRDMVLRAIATHGGLSGIDQKAMAASIWAESKNPKGQWDKMLTALRQEGLIRDQSLTEAGWVKAESLGVVPSDRKPTLDET